MKTFEFRHATTVEDAIASGNAPGARYLAGGTNLLDLMKGGVEQPEALVDLRRLALTTIAPTAEGGAFIEAGVTNSAIANHPLIRAQYPVVSHAILSGATTQLRNMATAGGNLLQRTRCPYFMQTAFSSCNKRVPGSGCAARHGFHREHAVFGASDACVAVHPSDMAVALAILDAVVHVQGPDGRRAIPIDGFFALPGTTPDVDNTLRDGELILGIELPPSDLADHSWYLKVRDRHSYAFALVSVAAGLRVVDGVIASAGLALGGVAAKPWRLYEAERILVGRPPGEEAFHAAAARAMDGAEPLPQNAFKIDLGRHSVVRALHMAAAVRGDDA
ncbi:FAD binding domain-containing protein [Mycolicibacterium litorale]|uniref:FAD-binding molybdopterin dehydrogenase n=1 Tax=Mycolicibacterium litorale TaxID=758802 RepID=A0AAD1MU13_9MYCO|nr:xanthine dehydrogenase family protein subunit M [Mycolicibacterium litorale]MCV7415896.1 xanthine dehydrogenase family protein subunit M [Mycolicibacterium litorale]TDY09148.1 xanthine dehydrogenase YagS FAD-binding subunit [Mycolicibacterium litorale]BBY17085.1 FAD-binding molybdopterin dehydrogenase [Mycolicibacterium litorale]